jgi:hypothetical protein
MLLGEVTGHARNPIYRAAEVFGALGQFSEVISFSQQKTPRAENMRSFLYESRNFDIKLFVVDLKPV